MKDALKVLGIALLTILLVAGLTWGGWAFKVAMSDTKGRGDAIIQKNSATNRIAKQERFEELYAEVKSADARIAVAREAVKVDSSVTNKTNLAGIVNYCMEVAMDYDAEARKYSSAEFRSIDLPAQIDVLAPATDCK